MIKFPLYLVPFDFTSVSENAADLALQLAKKNNGQAYLLHIVSSKKEKQGARTKLQQYIDQMADKDYFYCNVIHGDVFTDLGKAIELLIPNLVVLGTHGAKGFRKFFGSHMDKIISNSNSPLLIIQDKCDFDAIENIVMPFNFSKESLQITSFAANMAKKFDAKIQLIPNDGANDVEEAQVSKNKVITQRYLTENEVPFCLHELDENESFEKGLIKYAKNESADIIAVAYTNSNFFGTTNIFMNHIIENEEKIPVLTYSSEELSQNYY